MGAILFGFKDVSGANALLPVARRARSTGHHTLLYADGVSFDRFKTEAPLISAAYKPAEVLAWFEPDAVITTTDSPGGVVPFDLVAEARDRDIPVVVVQDYEGNHLKSDWGAVRPDLFCVPSRFGMQIVLDRWPDYHPSKITVTGNPAFDRLKDVDVEKMHAALLEALWPNGFIPGRPILVFAGQIWGMPQAVEMTIEALNLIGKPVNFVLRSHPRLTAPDAPPEYLEIQAACEAAVAKLACGRIIDSSHVKSGDTVFHGADIVVGMYSTALIEACHLRIPTISVWPEEAADALAKETAGTLTAFPPAELGGALQASDAVSLAGCFNQVLEHRTEGMRLAQVKYYRTDGKAAERVFSAADKLF